MDDVLQEAALIGLTRFGSFKRGSNFAGWMAQIVRHAAANQTRKNERHGAATRNAAALEDVASPGVAHGAMHSGNAPLEEPGASFDDEMEHALRSLAQDARTCLLLHSIEGLTHAEIADLLGVPSGTVASHLHRARAAMREALDPQRIKPSEDRDGAKRLII